MKIYRNCNWQYIKMFVLWCLFVLLVYWYSANDGKTQHKRKYIRLDRLDTARIKDLHASKGEGKSVVRMTTSDGDVSNEKQSGISKHTPGDEVNEISKVDKENVISDYQQMTSDTLYIDTLPSSEEETIFRDNKNHHNEDEFELVESQINNTSDNNHPSDDGSRDARHQHAKDESGEDTGVISSQGSLIISTLGEQLENPLALNANHLHWTIALAGTYSEKLYSPPPNEIPQQRLPQAIIIGFGKCGTRALISFLGMHPYVVTAGPEMHFFDIDENFQKGSEWYRQQMPLSYSNQITIEKTPSYIVSERALEEIYKLNKRMKLIILLKDPVSRIVSQSIRSNPDIQSTCLHVKDGRLQVNNASRTVQWSVYVKFVKMWMGKFPKSQIHVLETYEFVRQPAKVIQKLETFLGVPPMITEDNFYFNKTKGFYCKRPFHVKRAICLPEGKGIKHPTLLPAVEKALYGFFTSYNEDLFRLLGRRFDWQPKHFTETTKDKK